VRRHLDTTYPITDKVPELHMQILLCRSLDGGHCFSMGSVALHVVVERVLA
jgi:hypothetical protein